MRKLACLFMAFITTMCMSYSIAKSVDGVSTVDWRWIFLFFLIYILLIKAQKYFETRLVICSVVFGIAISMCNIVGYVVERYFVFNTIPVKKDLIVILLKMGSMTVITTAITMILFKRIPEFVNRNKSKESVLKLSEKKWIVLLFILFFLAYLPYMLYYYPGNILTDSTMQILQGMGDIELTSHHPPIHTAIITLFIKLGKCIFGSYNTGAFLYTLVQVSVTALLFSIAIVYMRRKSINTNVRWICFLYWAICPTIAFLSITMYKDIPFALSFLVMTILLIELITNYEKFVKSKLRIIIAVLSVFGVSIFRNNGIFAMVLATPIIMFMIPKKNRKLIGTLMITGMLLCVMVTGPVYSMLNIKKGSPREAYSVIIQQFARVTKYQGDELEDDEREAIHKYLPIENISELYMTGSADPVKSHFDDNAYEQDKLTFFKTYFTLLKKYPLQTMEAFLCNNYPYYYPNTLGWGVYTGVEQSVFLDKGVDYGIVQAPILKISFLDKVNTFVNQKNIPIVNMFISIGFIFWIALFGFMFCIYSKRYDIAAVYVPLFCTWLTVLAGPWCGDPRYVYPFFTCLPLILAISFNENVDYKELQK